MTSQGALYVFSLLADEAPYCRVQVFVTSRVCAYGCEVPHCGLQVFLAFKPPLIPLLGLPNLAPWLFPAFNTYPSDSIALKDSIFTSSTFLLAWRKTLDHREACARFLLIQSRTPTIKAFILKVRTDILESVEHPPFYHRDHAVPIVSHDRCPSVLDREAAGSIQVEYTCKEGHGHC